MFLFLYKWILAILAAVPVQAQVTAHYDLSDKLSEISGLELLNDSTLIAFNDGGNKPELYLLDLKGKILRTVEVKDAKNHDWEDIARDDNYIYIGDFGNNTNKRDNLSILKIRVSDIIRKDEVNAEEIKFSYAEQREFPPKNDSLYYDAEGMTFYNDSLWIFTKDRSEPFSGYSHIYKIPTTPGKYTVASSEKVFIGPDGWWKDGITGVDVYGDDFYFLTYDRYEVKKRVNGAFENVSKHVFDATTQRESIVVLNNHAIFVADEDNPIVGPVQMYKIQP